MGRILAWAIIDKYNLMNFQYKDQYQKPNMAFYQKVFANMFQI